LDVSVCLAVASYHDASVVYLASVPGLEKPGVFGRSFQVLRFYCAKKTGHKVTTQQEHPI